MIAELKALTEIAQVAKVVAPLFTKKKKQPEFVKEPVIVGGKIQHETESAKDEREFDLKRTLITLVVSALMAFGVSKGWITTEEADVIDDIVIEKIDEATD